MTKLKTLTICAILALCGLAAESRAAALVVVGGELQGATGVNVGGTLYSVEFLDGSCVSLFSGCDNATDDFDFTNGADALAAAQALLDQVFLDVIGTGLFDTDPSLTRGCSIASVCTVLIPHGDFGGGSIAVAGAHNNDSVTEDFGPTLFGISPPTLDFAFVRGQVWAVFTAEVPEPATMALFGVGLAGLAFARRRRAVR